MLRFILCINFIIFITVCLQAQLNVQNNGVLYIGPATDSLYISGNFNNQSAAAFTNNGKLYLAGNFTNTQSGTAPGTGELILVGSGAQTISTTSNSPLNKLTINKSSNIATLASAVTINNELKFTAGKLSLADYDITIGNSAFVSGASASSYFITSGNGGLKQQVENNSNKFFPVGTSSYYTPATVALSAGSATDVFKVRMLPAFYKNGANGITQNSYVVNCLWNITEATAGDSEATLTLQWPAELELINFNRTNARIAHYHNSDWDYGFTNINASGTNPYSAARSGVTDFSPFGIANYMAVLPNDQLNAEVINETENNIISWKPVNGTVADFFEIEYAADGQSFSTISTVAARNDLVSQAYRFVHSTQNNRTLYYRVKQVEISGKIFYSKILKIVLNGNTTISLYPNPVTSIATVEINNKHKGAMFITVTDVAGRILYSGKYSKNTTALKIQLNVADYPKGLYKVVLSDETGSSQSLQFLKN